jgi:toxin YoeB
MKPVKSLAFDPAACEDLAWWIQQDRKKVLPLVKLIKEAQRTPCTGTGKPEALKHELAGCWSRRILVGSLLRLPLFRFEGCQRLARGALFL